MRSLVLFLAAVFALCVNKYGAEGAKILAVFPFPGRSQTILVQPYLRALAARGHEVTVITAYPQKEAVKNLREIPAMRIFESYTDIIAEVTVKRNLWSTLNFYQEFFTKVTLSVLEEPRVQQLLRSNEHFDLVIVEMLQTDAHIGFAQHFKAPLVGFSSFGTDPQIDEYVGNTSPVSYVPLVTHPLTDRMTYAQRLHNLALTTLELLHIHTRQLPQQAEMYRKHFPNATIDFYELRRNFALVLLNQHFALSFPRPYVPNMIEVGGLHLDHKHAAAPLPADMQAFIDASPAGVVYFSLGSNIKSKDLPAAKLALLLRTFAALRPVRVMWKFEETDLRDKPDNVYISKWFPQADLLAQPRVRLFVTHGGLLSSIEAIYHGKPIVGIPVFYDQFLNVARAKQAGFGLGVDFDDLQQLQPQIERVLRDESFAKVAAQMSRHYRDQPMTPLDTAIWWTEYVLRHGGGAHMRVAAQDLSFVQRHSLDTMAVLFGGLLLLLVLVFIVVFKCVSLVLPKKASKLKVKSQ